MQHLALPCTVLASPRAVHMHGGALTTTLYVSVGYELHSKQIIR